MVHHLITSRLAAHSTIRQVEASVRADAAATAVDRAIGGLWRRLLGELRDNPHPWEARNRCLAILRELPALAHQTIHGSLTRIADWGHRSARANLLAVLPVGYLEFAAQRRMFGRTIQESTSEIREDFPTEPQPGLLKLVMRALGLETIDLASALRPPAVDELTDAQKRDIFAKLLFPAPSLETVTRIIFATVQGQPWPERIKKLSKLAPPEQLANTVAQGLAAGKSQREIARDLLPHVDNYRASARRVARTEGLRVAHAIKMQTSQGLGDLVDGFQILAVLDSVTRPRHRARNGKTWYKDSGEAMQTALEMEDGHLPDAPNCRCHLSEILKPPSWVQDKDRLKPFTDNADKLIPDPSVYSDWFEKADERRRRIAVGSRRYQAVQTLLGTQEPTYAHFVNPDTGDMLPIASLKAESAADRAARMAKVNAIAAERRQLIRTIATFGFHPERPAVAGQPASTILA